MNTVLMILVFVPLSHAFAQEQVCVHDGLNVSISEGEVLQDLDRHFAEDEVVSVVRVTPMDDPRELRFNLDMFEFGVSPDFITWQLPIMLPGLSLEVPLAGKIALEVGIGLRAFSSLRQLSPPPTNVRSQTLVGMQASAGLSYELNKQVAIGVSLYRSIGFGRVIRGVRGTEAENDAETEALKDLIAKDVKAGFFIRFRPKGSEAFVDFYTKMLNETGVRLGVTL